MNAGQEAHMPDKWGPIEHIDPAEVPLRKTGAVSRRDIEKQKSRLQEEGLIEPIALTRRGYPDPNEFAYAEAQVLAARELEWPDIIVVRPRPRCPETEGTVEYPYITRCLLDPDHNGDHKYRTDRTLRTAAGRPRSAS